MVITGSWAMSLLLFGDTRARAPSSGTVVRNLDPENGGRG
jgi:hypothetical protein